MRRLGVDHALLLASSLALHQGLARKIEVLKGLEILLAGQISALKIKQPIDGNVDHVFDPAAVDSDFIRMAVLKDDLDERTDRKSLAPVQTPKLFHILAHAILCPLWPVVITLYIVDTHQTSGNDPMIQNPQKAMKG